MEEIAKRVLDVDDRLGMGFMIAVVILATMLLVGILRTLLRLSVKQRSERKQVLMAVTLVIEGDEAEYRATAVDLSRHGLRLQSDAALAPNQPVGLLLATEPDCLIKARVVWVGKADSTQAGQAGFEFLNPLTRPVC